MSNLIDVGKYAFDYNVVRKFNNDCDMLDKLTTRLCDIKSGKDAHLYSFNKYERLFSLKWRIADMDSKIEAMMMTCMYLDVDTCINCLLDLISKKDKLEKEFEIRRTEFRKLPDFDKRILYLRFAKGLSIERIAKVMNVSIRTVGRYFRRYGRTNITDGNNFAHKITSFPNFDINTNRRKEVRL